jgi:N-acetylglucosamine-6-phosphate deacetylase
VALANCTLAFSAAPGRICLVTDAAACAGMPAGEYLLGGEPITLPPGDGVPPRRADGGLAGSALRIDRAVANMALLARGGDPPLRFPGGLPPDRFPGGPPPAPPAPAPAPASRQPGEDTPPARPPSPAIGLAAGTGLAAAVAAASRVPADLIGRPDLGRLAPGAAADFVWLDDDLRTAATWIDGERVYP